MTELLFVGISFFHSKNVTFCDATASSSDRREQCKIMKTETLFSEYYFIKMDRILSAYGNFPDKQSSILSFPQLCRFDRSRPNRGKRMVE